MSILTQLLEIYYTQEPWHKTIMSLDDAIKYHAKLLNWGNIIYYQENGRLLGYVEYWKINATQFGMLIANVPFSATHEDIKGGNIAFVANLWIRKNMRKSHVGKMLSLMFFKHIKDCNYIAGYDKRKKRMRVYRR